MRPNARIVASTIATGFRLVGHVGALMKASTTELLDFRRDAREIGRGARTNRDVGAFLRIRERDRAADSLAAAGNQRNFVVEPHCRISPSPIELDSTAG
jgi:hypothetical protein